jgi:hypothetical protein
VPRVSSCSCSDVFLDVAASDDSVGVDLAIAGRNREAIICSVAASPLVLLVLRLPLSRILVEVACSAVLFGVMCSFIGRPEPAERATWWSWGGEFEEVL